jgi:polysaccharide deacetylase 2 family uncharacterized protein YibQ
LALIIDDFGPPGTARLAPAFLQMPFDLTISIIPGNPKSVAVHRLARAAGREVFIHLPMEPLVPQAMDEKHMVSAGVDSSDLAEIMARVTRELPGAAGLNNHMGSRATLDEGTMRLLAGELLPRGLVFVDSRTAEGSLGYQVMIAHGVPALWRDVFLDNDRDTSRIAGQLRQLVDLARRRGWALGIGHCCRETLE